MTLLRTIPLLACALLAPPGCDEPDTHADADERSDALSTPAKVAADERSGAVPACGGEQADRTLEFAWDGVSAARDARVTDMAPALELRNVTRQDLEVELVAQTMGSGGRIDRVVGARLLRAGASERFEGVPLEVPGGDADYSTQLRVIARIGHEGRSLVDLPAPALWFHPVDDGFLVYDDDGLARRHRKGDIHRLMFRSDADLAGVDGVGKARLLTGAELLADPAAARDRSEVTP